MLEILAGVPGAKPHRIASGTSSASLLTELLDMLHHTEFRIAGFILAIDYIRSDVR